VGKAIGVGLDGVGQGVDAGVSRDVRRQALRQRRVHQGHVGIEARADNPFLEMRFRIREDGDGRHLAARAGRGGDEHLGQAWQRDAVNAHIVHDGASVGPHHRSGLGDIQRAAAPKADQAVTRKAPGRGQALFHNGQARVWLDAIKDRPGDAGSVQQLQHLIRDAGAHQTAIRHNEGALHTQARQRFGQATQSAPAKDQAPAHLHLENPVHEEHLPQASGLLP